jgi:hypothetical protein
MNNGLTLFEQLIIWMSRNKRQFTMGHEVYNHRIYKQGAYTFMELSDTTVAIVGMNLYYKATSLVELIKFVDGIED